MSCLTIVIASDVGFVLSRQAPLSGVNVYNASIRTIRGTIVVRTLPFVVSLVGLRWATPALTLLFTRVLPIVDSNGYSDIYV